MVWDQVATDGYGTGRRLNDEAHQRWKSEREERYNKLALDFSNMFMEADANLVAGRKNTAIEQWIMAGNIREKMGNIKEDMFDYTSAAEDFFCARDCYAMAGTDECKCMAAAMLLKGKNVLITHAQKNS